MLRALFKKTRLLCAASVACGLLAACSESISIDGIPPGSIADLTANVVENEVRLSWTEPGEPDLRGSMIARFPVTGVDGTPEPGRAYAPGDSIGKGVAIFQGSGAETVDLPPCTQHIYAGWAQDAAGNWSLSAETIQVTGVSGVLPPSPTGLAASITGHRIDLAWTPPTDPRSASVRIVRKLASAPANPSDGQTVFGGSAATFSDASAELSPQVTWHYTAFACNPCGECESAGTHVEVTPTLMQSLGGGGYVIYWRHTTATTCADRQDLGSASSAAIPEWWKSCDRNCGTALARQLDDPIGVEEAQEIGRALRAKAIPFSRVISSEYCRCRETAEHMRLGLSIETTPQVTFFVYPEIDRCAAAFTQLATVPAAGSNTAIVAHLYAECIEQGGPDLTLANGQAAIYKPDGTGGAKLIAKVMPTEWASLP